MQLFQTIGTPPRMGRIILPIIGCTMNSRNALTNSVTANNASTPMEAAAELNRTANQEPRIASVFSSDNGLACAGLLMFKPKCAEAGRVSRKIGLQGTYPRQSIHL
jgi:hypothetical protein